MIELGIAGFAALATYLTTNFFSMRATDLEALGDHSREIKQIERLALEYWLEDCKSANCPEEQRRYALLAGAMTASSCFNAEARRILGCHFRQYQLLDDELYEAVTGGSYATTNRKADFERATEIITVCNKLCAHLRQAKRAQFWVK